MKDYILFSGLGDTDPYRDGYDGAMIHIVRYYKPKKIYLYYSKEKWKEENINNRCKRAIKFLEKDAEIEEFPKNESELIVDVHKYDMFYAPFMKIMNKIKKENPDSIILLNMSSGTPAMKTTMSLISILFSDVNVKLIQVATPKKSTNVNVKHDIVSKDEDVEYIMENLIDSLKDEEDLNRCTEESLEQTRKMITYDNIVKMFEKYDFCGVYNILEERKEFYNSNIINYAKHLYYRYIGDIRKATEIARELGKEDELFPIKDEKTKWIIEKYNILDVKLKRKEYQDYLVGVGSLIEEIEKKLLELKGVEVSKFTYVAKNNSKAERKKDNNIELEKLNKYYPDIFNVLNLKKDRLYKLNWIILEQILDYKYDENDKKDKIQEKIDNIGAIREDRNTAAHTIKINSFNVNEYVKAHKDLKFLITKIKVGKDEKFNECMNIYEKIKNEILILLKEDLIKSGYEQ